MSLLRRVCKAAFGGQFKHNKDKYRKFLELCQGAGRIFVQKENAKNENNQRNDYYQAHDKI
jgi:hypothetical protein